MLCAARRAVVALLTVAIFAATSGPLYAGTALSVTVKKEVVFAKPGTKVSGVVEATNATGNVTWSLPEEAQNPDAFGLISIDPNSAEITVGTPAGDPQDFGQYSIYIEAADNNGISPTRAEVTVIVGDFPGMYYFLNYDQNNLTTELYSSNPSTGEVTKISQTSRTLGGKVSAFDIANGVGYFFVDVTAGADTFYTADLETGEFNLLATLPAKYESTTAFAIAETNGVFTPYFISSDSNSQKLLTFNLSDVIQTPNQVLQPQELLAFDPSDPIAGLAVNRSGTLYATRYLETDYDVQRVYKINLKTTPASYSVSGVLRLHFDSIDFDANGRLLGLTNGLALYVLKLGDADEALANATNKTDKVIYDDNLAATTLRRIYNMPTNSSGFAFAILDPKVQNESQPNTDTNSDSTPEPQPVFPALVPTGTVTINNTGNTFTCTPPTFDKPTDSIAFAWKVDGQDVAERTNLLKLQTQPQSVMCFVTASATGGTATIAGDWSPQAKTTPAPQSTPTPTATPTPTVPATTETQPQASSPLVLDFSLTKTSLTPAHRRAIANSSVLQAQAITLEASARNGGNKAANRILARQRAQVTERALRAAGFKGKITVKISLSVPKVVIRITE